ncbi:MAG: glycerophosphodiester phosphodiesterase [Acidimicrobiales bacterium]|nr:glycerophosphodiester phosphodiesterase [Acidimicrobiales bacterium]MCB9373039.1 glycerophosphodiester phosphodiesterase [Microthrixaceae bacterium]
MTLVIAHRGASARFPENTVAAFEGARALGADWVELDVRLARDGALVVLHDEALTDGRLLHTLTRGEIDPAVPSLAEALDACEGMGVNVEIKNLPLEDAYDPTMAVVPAVVEELRRRGDPERWLVSCFDLATVDACHELAPELPTAFLVLDPQGGDAVDVAAAHGHRALHPWVPMVDEALIERAHAAGLALNTWTVDDPERIVELAAHGADGVVTNAPDVARAALDG